MFYPLSSVHILIYEVIHPETILQGEPARLPADTWRHLKQEIEQSKLHLFSHLSQANGSDSLRVIVYTCQAGYISLINRLGRYLSQTGKHTNANDTYSSLCCHYGEIRKLLIVHLQELYKNYFPFFDLEQTVPRFLLAGKQLKIRTQTATIRQQLTVVCDDPALVSIVCFPFEQIGDCEQPNLTYRQLHYMLQFLTELIRYCFVVKPFASITSVTDFLIKKNFNEPTFIQNVIEQLRKQITDEMSLHEQAEKWAFHIKEFKLLPIATSHGLYPERPSTKAYLVIAAEQELLFLKQKMSLLSTVTNVFQPHQKTNRNVITYLTVSQLGVFVRLLVDCKLIQSDNQSELLKLIGGCISTTKTSQISAESLRVRYYNPDKASISITKEYLLQMLKQLNQY